MTSRKKLTLIILGVIVLFGIGYYVFKGKPAKATLKNEMSQTEKLKKNQRKASQQMTKIQQQQIETQQRTLNSISQTQKTIKSIDEINRMNQLNQQLQKDLERQNRKVGR